MLSADFLIINSKGEIDSKMIDTLNVCCITYDEIKHFGNDPKIIYTYCQNNDSNKDSFEKQISKFK